MLNLRFFLLLGACLGPLGPPALALEEDGPDSAALDCVITPRAQVEVSAAVPGLLEAVLVDRSSIVEAGQVIARLESGVEEAAAELARGWASVDTEIRLQEVGSERDQRKHARLNQLYEQRAVALQTKEEAAAEARLMQLRVRQARDRQWLRELELVKAQASLTRRTVRSPVSGVVIHRYRTPGEYVENQPIVRIAELDPLHVETIVPMARFGQIRVGGQATVVPEIDLGGPLTATVALVDPVGDPASGTFGVRLALPNPQRRIPAGLKCSVRFDSAAAPESSPAPAEPPALAPPPPSALPPASPPAYPPAYPLASPPASAQAYPPPPPAAQTPRWMPEPPPTAPPEQQRALPAPPAEARATPASAHLGETGSCHTIGPIAVRDTAAALARRLDDTGRHVHLRQAPEEVPAGFIVLSSHRTNPASAAREAASLRERGVDDIAALHRGQYAGRISFGVYNGERTAARRQQELAGLGMETELVTRLRETVRWWLDTTSSGTRSGITSVLAEASPTPEIQTRPCAQTLAAGG